MIAYEAIVGAAAYTSIATMTAMRKCCAGTSPYPWERPAEEQPASWRSAQLRTIFEPCLARDRTARPTAVALVTVLSRFGHSRGPGWPSLDKQPVQLFKTSERLHDRDNLASELNIVATAEPAQLFAGRYRLATRNAEWEQGDGAVSVPALGSGRFSRAEHVVKCAQLVSFVVAARKVTHAQDPCDAP